MPANVGVWDRVIRVILAIVLAGIARGETGALAVVLWVVAAILLITGLIGRCGIYALFHIRTCPARSR